MSHVRRPLPPRSAPARAGIRADGTPRQAPRSGTGRAAGSGTATVGPAPVPSGSAAVRSGSAGTGSARIGSARTGPARRAVLGALGAVGLGAVGAAAVATQLPLREPRLVGQPAAAGPFGSGALPEAAEAPAEVEPVAVPAATYPVRPPRVLRYGTDHERQFGELLVPDLRGTDAAGRPVPVVIVVHGGAWGTWLGLDSMRPMAQRIASLGIATWNIEYRGDEGNGAWPELFEDAAAGADFVPELARGTDVPLDTDHVVAIGHSAGAQLAVWLTGRGAIAQGLPGADPVVRVRGAIGLAGVYDFVPAARQQNLQIERLFGGAPEDMPEAYRAVSPIELLPTGSRLALFHGTGDAVVPYEQSATFAERARAAGDRVDLVLAEGLDHDAWTDLGGEAYAAAEQHLLRFARDGVRPPSPRG
jgi:acetyl esterase/lipase